MECKLYWILNQNASRLGIMPRPRGGEWLEDEIRSLRDQGVDVLISLLTPEEITELDLQKEASLCQALGIRFFQFAIEDRTIPRDREMILELVKDVSHLYKQRKAIAIHCRAGIGRASVLAACVLATEGFAVEHAFTIIGAARGCPVPDTAEQHQWVRTFIQEGTKEQLNFASG
jgi:protein-tyrosine phosphatase